MSACVPTLVCPSSSHFASPQELFDPTNPPCFVQVPLVRDLIALFTPRSLTGNRGIVGSNWEPSAVTTIGGSGGSGGAPAQSKRNELQGSVALRRAATCGIRDLELISAQQEGHVQDATESFHMRDTSRPDHDASSKIDSLPLTVIRQSKSIEEMRDETGPGGLDEGSIA